MNKINKQNGIGDPLEISGRIKGAWKDTYLTNGEPVRYNQRRASDASCLLVYLVSKGERYCSKRHLQCLPGEVG